MREESAGTPAALKRRTACECTCLSDTMNKRDEVAEAVRRYCADHPRAADTLEGVRGWLGPEHQAVPRHELQAVLDGLVAGQVLTRRLLADGTVVYFSVAPDNA